MRARVYVPIPPQKPHFTCKTWHNMPLLGQFVRATLMCATSISSFGGCRQYCCCCWFCCYPVVSHMCECVCRWVPVSVHHGFGHLINGRVEIVYGRYIYIVFDSGGIKLRNSIPNNLQIPNLYVTAGAVEYKSSTRKFNSPTIIVVIISIIVSLFRFKNKHNNEHLKYKHKLYSQYVYCGYYLRWHWICVIYMEVSINSRFNCTCKLYTYIKCTH